MGFTIRLSTDGTFIVLKVTGSVTRKSAMVQNLEAHALGERLSIGRYLVDLTEARNTESEIEGYDFAYQDMQTTDHIDRQARVAMVVAPGDTSHDFIETVARNAGLDVTIFHDMPTARQHLAGDRAPRTPA